MGNSNSTFYDQGNMDAMRGEIFFGDGKGNFDLGKPVKSMNHNYIVNSAAVIHSYENKADMILMGVNNDTLRTYLISK